MSDPMLPLAGLSPLGGKAAVAKFDGGLLSSDGGVLALREVEQRLRVAERLAACDPSYAERDELLLQKPLGVLNAALTGREFLSGGSFSVADLNVASILVWGKMARLGLSSHPEVKGWLDKCLARPAYGRVRDWKSSK